jgi:hypothetical protein
MTKFLKAGNGEILTAGIDLKRRREAKITVWGNEQEGRETMHDEILKGWQW